MTFTAGVITGMFTAASLFLAGFVTVAVVSQRANIRHQQRQATNRRQRARTTWDDLDRQVDPAKPFAEILAMSKNDVSAEFAYATAELEYSWRSRLRVRWAEFRLRRRAR